MCRRATSTSHALRVSPFHRHRIKLANSRPLLISTSLNGSVQPQGGSCVLERERVTSSPSVALAGRKRFRLKSPMKIAKKHTRRSGCSGSCLSPWSMWTWRHSVCIPLVVLLPALLLSQEPSSAMLRSNGLGVLVNKTGVPASIALMRNDLIETQRGAVTRIETTGSTADVNPETMVQFAGDELVLDHGSLSVNSSRGLRVRVGCVTITPVNPSTWTQYDVVDRDGKVTVSALKSDVYLDARSSNVQPVKKSAQSNRSIVRETEQKSRDENCGGAQPPRGSGVGAGAGAWLNNPWVIGGAAAAAVAVCIGICRREDPLSPDSPRKN